MTTAEASGALARMRARAGSVQREPGPPDVQRYRVALEHPIAAGMIATGIILEFRRDRLRTVRLGIEGAGDRETIFRDLVSAYTASLGQPLRAATRVDWVTWQAEGVETTIVGAIADAAPVEVWLTDTAAPECPAAQTHSEMSSYAE
jgi:hypothetical protein